MDKKLKNEIKEALGMLDVNNPEHWTTDGLPRLDVLSGLTGKEVKRKMVTDIAPAFSLTNPVLGEKLPAGEGEGAADDDSWLDDPAGGAGEGAGSDEGADEGDDAPEAAAKAPAAPQTQETNVKAKPAVPEFTEDDRAAFDADIDALNQKLSRDKTRKDTLEKEIAATERALARKLDEKNAAFPPMSEAQALRQHIESQHAQRAGRMAGAARLAQLAGTKVIEGKSPLDAAMARKTARGAHRPMVGMMDSSAQK